MILCDANKDYNPIKIVLSIIFNILIFFGIHLTLYINYRCRIENKTHDISDVITVWYGF